MCINSIGATRYRFRLATVVGLSFVTAIVPDLSEAVQPPETPTVSSPEGAIHALEHGADRQAILQDLVEIARSSRSSRRGCAALNAAFHVAESDAERRGYLYEVIGNRDVSLDVHYVACDLLVYVADAGARQVLLKELIDRWSRSHSQWSSLYRALRELGDPGLLARLEASRGVENGIKMPREMLDWEIQHLRAVNTGLQALREEFASIEKGLDRPWMLRQMVRLGARKEELLSLVLAYIRETPLREDIRVGELARICDKWEIFDDDARGECEGLLEIGKREKGTTTPVWAEPTIEAARRAYWNLPVQSGQ